MQFETPSGRRYEYDPCTGGVYDDDGGPEVEVLNPPLVRKPLNATGRLQQLTLEVTQRCNLACTYCHHAHGGLQGVRPHTDLQMGREVADAALGLLDTLGDQDTAVSHYGGEPLLNLELVRYVVEARPQHYHQVDTNGVLVTDELARWAAGHNVGWQISLDGPPAATDRYRGAGVAAAAVRAVELIRARRPDARIVISCTLAPPYQLDETAAWFDQALPGVHVNARVANLAGCPGLEAEALDVSAWRRRYVAAAQAGQAEAIPQVVRRLIEPQLERFDRHQVGPRERWVPGGCCDPGVRRLHVMADGQLRPCEKLGSEYPIGDVWTGIDWVAVDRMHEEYFQRRVALGCQDCWAVRFCSGCWATGTPDCDGIKERLKVALGTFAEVYGNRR